VLLAAEPLLAGLLVAGLFFWAGSPTSSAKGKAR
jgi:hypothetical protein